jgi:hypothetical protein
MLEAVSIVDSWGKWMMVASWVVSLLRTRPSKAAARKLSLLRPGRIRRVKTAIHELLPAAADFPLAKRTCDRVERRALRQRHAETETES